MNKVELSLEQIQERILGVLIYLDEICRENGITYYLSGGTMLGAVREKGFIPWDDDADIMLPREDYMRLIGLLQKKQDPRFKLCCSLYNDDDYPYGYLYDTMTEVKNTYVADSTVGLGVDIFPMDGLPESMLLTKLHYYRIWGLWALLRSTSRETFRPNERNRILKQILKSFAVRIGGNKIAKRLDAVAGKRKYNSSKYIGVAIMQNYMWKERVPRKAFKHVKKIPFETEQFPVPTGYDEYLSSIYGDYMTPPDGSARKPHHNRKVYLTEA